MNDDNTIKPIITGTGGDFDIDKGDMQAFFENSENFNIIPFPENPPVKYFTPSYPMADEAQGVTAKDMEDALPKGDFVDPSMPQPWMSYQEYEVYQKWREEAEAEALNNRFWPCSEEELRRRQEIREDAMKLKSPTDKRKAEYPLSPKECYPGTEGTPFQVELNQEDMGSIRVPDVEFFPRVLTEEEIRANYEKKRRDFQ